MTQNRIVIILHATDLTLADWHIIAESGDVIESVTKGNLSELSSSSTDNDIIVIAPAVDVLLLTATLPKLNRHQLLQALPYALEEQLIDDVSELHFAIGEYQPNGTLPVAVVAKQKMQSWLDRLRTAGIEPSIMMSMIHALPINEKEWEVYSFDHTCMVRTGKYTGFAAETDIFESVLQMQLAESSSTDIKIAHLNTPSTPSFSMINSKGTFINLLQPPYTTKRKMTRTKNVWTYAAYAAAAWIGISLVSNIISFFILHYQSSQIENQMHAIYSRHFPHATSMVAPRERMEQKLKDITSAAQKNNFLSLLATVGKSLSKSTGIRLQHLDYRNGLLTLEVSSGAFDNVDMLINDLNSHGLTVKQQNSATVGSQIKSTLLINAGSA